MKVLIDARLISGRSGGVEQAVIGLANALSTCNQSEFQFIWLMFEKETDWLEKHLPESSTIIEMGRPNDSSVIRNSLIRFMRSFPLTQRLLPLIRKFGPWKYELPPEPDIISTISPDVIHFPTQFGFKTNYPNIYQPHDLQHLHFPMNFPLEVLLIRKVGYGAMLKQASRIVVGNAWTKNDVELHYPKTKGKVENVPVFPQLLPSISNSLPDKFLFKNRKYLYYPAAGWIHKNHIRLFSALAIVRNDGLELDLVLSGTNLEENQSLLQEINRLGLVNHVHIMGFVNTSILVGLYKGAAAVIVPSVFESASFPIWEAFNLGVPVISATTTSLPEQARNSAEFFDPFKVNSISEAIKNVIRGGPKVDERVKIGAIRVKQFTAKNTAIGYRFSYRRSLSLPYDEIDLEWINSGVRF